MLTKKQLNQLLDSAKRQITALEAIVAANERSIAALEAVVKGLWSIKEMQTSALIELGVPMPPASTIH